MPPPFCLLCTAYSPSYTLPLFPPCPTAQVLQQMTAEAILAATKQDSGSLNAPGPLVANGSGPTPPPGANPPSTYSTSTSPAVFGGLGAPALAALGLAGGGGSFSAGLGSAVELGSTLGSTASWASLGTGGSFSAAHSERGAHLWSGVGDGVWGHCAAQCGSQDGGCVTGWGAGATCACHCCWGLGGACLQRLAGQQGCGCVRW
jgi:hypothetical protein